MPRRSPQWRPDELATSCTACKREFTLFVRKHHCRGCGGIFCSICTASRIPLPQFGYEGNQRVCDACLHRLLGDDAGVDERHHRSPESTASSDSHPPDFLEAPRSRTPNTSFLHRSLTSSMSYYLSSSHFTPVTALTAGLVVLVVVETRGLCDFGPGLAICHRCSRKPILNRGCRRCERRFCAPCYKRHGTQTPTLSPKEIREEDMCIAPLPESRSLVSGIGRPLLTGYPAFSTHLFPVRVVVHEGRGIATGGLTKPNLYVLVQLSGCEAQTRTVMSSSNPHWAEAFDMQAGDPTSDVFFRVFEDSIMGGTHDSSVGRACVPLSSLREGRCGDTAWLTGWLELYPAGDCASSATLARKFRSPCKAIKGELPGTMKRPKGCLGWIRVTVAMESTSPLMVLTAPAHLSDAYHAPEEDFSSNLVLYHFLRLQVVWNDLWAVPPLLALIWAIPSPLRAVVVAPMWYALCMEGAPWMAPLALSVSIIANGMAAGSQYLKRLAGSTVFEEDIPRAKETMGAKLRHVYQTAYELPSTLKRVQALFAKVASGAEKVQYMFSFLDITTSTASSILLGGLAGFSALILFLVPIRLLLFVAGLRLLFGEPDSTPKSDILVRYRRLRDVAQKRVSEVLRVESIVQFAVNLWYHLPDSIDLAHQAISHKQRHDRPAPTVNARSVTPPRSPHEVVL